MSKKIGSAQMLLHWNYRKNTIKNGDSITPGPFGPQKSINNTTKFMLNSLRSDRENF